MAAALDVDGDVQRVHLQRARSRLRAVLDALVAGEEEVA